MKGGHPAGRSFTEQRFIVVGADVRLVRHDCPRFDLVNHLLVEALQNVQCSQQLELNPIALDPLFQLANSRDKQRLQVFLQVDFGHASFIQGLVFLVLGAEHGAILVKDLFKDKLVNIKGGVAPFDGHLEDLVHVLDLLDSLAKDDDDVADLYFIHFAT